MGGHEVAGKAILLVRLFYVLSAACCFNAEKISK